jgi:hypothetical protein
MIMNEITCAYENQVKRSVTSGNWDEETRSHVAGCSICREVVSVSECLQSLTKASAVRPNLPDAAYIWWKAGLLQRQAAEKKVMRSIMLTRILAYVVFACGLGGWILYRWRQTREEIDRFSRWVFLQAGSNLASGVRPLIMLAVVLLALNIVLTLRTFMYEGRLKKRSSASGSEQRLS